MTESKRRVNIGAAGNTENPALLALASKGYTLSLDFLASGDDVRLLYHAEKDGAYFHASTSVELSGLVAIGKRAVTIGKEGATNRTSTRN